MLKEKIEKILNEQILHEAYSSQLYLAMATWAEQKGYDGTTEFLYAHADEEREHMLKLFHYVNERGGKAVVPALDQPPVDYTSVKEVFEKIYEHEKMISEKINDIADLTLQEKDYSTHTFIQWYINEQIEEERLASTILDRLELLGDDKARMYMFDRDIMSIRNQASDEGE